MTIKDEITMPCCPYCNSELIHWDSYGLFFAHQSGEKRGDIFMCPIGRGDEEGECESGTFNVAGSFYTDLNNNLNEGYPC